MRQLCVVAVTLTLFSVAAAQSLRVDEHASKIALRGTTYDVVLMAASTDAMRSATFRLEIIAPNGSAIASSSRETPGAQAPLRIAVNGSLQALPTNMGQTLGPQVLDISSLSREGKNTIEISGGSGTVTSAQTVTDYYVQWTSTLAVPKSGPLKLNVACDRTRIELGAKVTCGIAAERIGSAGHGMMIAEIGIPPGADVDREGLQKQMSENGWELSSFDVLPDRIVAYLWPRAGGTQFSLSFTPRMAIDAQSAPHTLFDYYNPDASVTVAPDRFIVVEPSNSVSALRGAMAESNHQQRRTVAPAPRAEPAGDNSRIQKR